MEEILIGLYIACELVANVTASKPVQIGGIVVPAAIFIYALTFTLIDLINESMGKLNARKVILAAFIANLLLAAYAQFAVALPPAPFYAGQEAFAAVLGSTPRIVFASLTAYLISSLIDAEIFALWRTHIRGPRWLRVLVSNTLSTGVDSVIFITLAFYGLMPIWGLIKGQYAVKMAITLVSLPLIYLVRSHREEMKKVPKIYKH
ncbi:MAG: queuosine precursor transporter [Thermodesulfobacteriota bacterium]|nr:queuosine precursor transporter [Thermodesulfobacteriota bacterium]